MNSTEPELENTVGGGGGTTTSKNLHTRVPACPLLAKPFQTLHRMVRDMEIDPIGHQTEGRVMVRFKPTSWFHLFNRQLPNF